MSSRAVLLRTASASGLALAAALAATSASAQSTEPTTGPGRVVTTQSQGQSDPSSQVQTNAQGLNSPGDNGTTVGEVVVTGSRITRRDFVADSPIVSVGPKAIENTGDVTLERTLTQLPQAVITQGAQVNNGGNGQVNLDLRDLGPTRTLVLLDGRRITPSNASGVVDLNTIPSALIENIEIITGGASAAYGSDAIAGVANFKLKHNFQGLVIDSQYNISEQGDGEQQAINITAGANFADDRGNAVVSFGYANRDPVFYGDRPNITTRDFADFGLTDPRILAVSGLSSTIPQGAYTNLANAGLNAAGTNVAGTNNPSAAAVNAVFGRYGVAAGAVPVGGNYGFNTDGTLFFRGLNYKGPTTLDYSTIPTTTSGTGPGSYNTGALNYVLTPQTKYNAFSRVEYEVNPHVKAYGQFIFSQFEANLKLAPTPAAGNPGSATNALLPVITTGFLVPVTNPYIPADLRTILASRTNPTAPFLFNKRFNDAGFRSNTIQYTTFQMLTGVRGDIPDPGNHDLTYDVYASYGRTARVDTQTGNVNRTAVRQYLEAPSGAFGGCTGYNPFGSNPIPAACLTLFSPVTKNTVTYTQRQVEGTIQGRALTLPDFGGGHFGGEVRFAFGADYRSDKVSSVPDSLAAAVDQSGTIGSATTPFNNAFAIAGFGAGSGVSGATDVYEVYGELLVPLVKDLPFAKEINLNLGGRFSDYNFSGLGRETQLNTTTYKADLEWKAFNWLLLRGGFSRAVRAPNVGDLFTPASTNFAGIGSPGSLGSGDPCDVTGAYRKGQGVSAAGVRALCLALGVPTGAIDTFQQANSQAPSTSQGNPFLQEERANTYSGGFVIQPKFSNPLFSRISLSVDYYNISIRGYITGVPIATTLSKCFNADGLNTTFDPNNFFCQQTQRDTATGQITNGFSIAQNFGTLKKSGVDFQVDWGFALSALPYLGLADNWGNLSFNLIGTWQNDLDLKLLPTDPYQNLRDSIEVQTAEPVWKALLGASYAVGRFDFGVTERYIGSARAGQCVGLTSDCTARGVVPTFYTDLTGRWKMTDMLELRVGITNATNQDPRFFNSQVTSQAFSDATTYDYIGRRYFVGLKARF